MFIFTIVFTIVGLYTASYQVSADNVREALESCPPQATVCFVDDPLVGE